MNNVKTKIRARSSRTGKNIADVAERVQKKFFSSSKFGSLQTSLHRIHKHLSLVFHKENRIREAIESINEPLCNFV